MVLRSGNGQRVAPEKKPSKIVALLALALTLAGGWLLLALGVAWGSSAALVGWLWAQEFMRGIGQ